MCSVPESESIHFYTRPPMYPEYIYGLIKSTKLIFGSLFIMQ